MTTTPWTHSSLPALPDGLAALATGVDLPDPLDAPALRWGIIGAGGIARTFARDVPRHTRSTVHAVGARDLDRARAFAEEFGVTRAYGSYEELVTDPDVDAVYVSTVHPMHARNATLALEAGKPVLVEKVFTISAREARDVLDLAGRSGLFAMEAMWSRQLPHYRVLRQVVENGLLGRVVSVQADHGQSLLHVPRMVEPELGGGALLDLGIYPVSFLHWVLGKPSTVSATGRLLGSGVDAADAVTLGTPGAIGVARCNLDGRSATGAEVVFEKGALELPVQFYRPGVLRLRTFPDGGPADGATVEWDSTLPGGFQYEAAEVARCLEAGVTQSPAMTWQDTIEVMDVMDQVRAQTGVTYPWE
jgi:Predicted dehydrogenases and related proteins